jgi:hypothetical protein
MRSKLLLPLLLLSCHRGDDDDGGGGRRSFTELRIDPSSVSLVAGATRQLRAMGFFSDGSMEDFTSEASWRTDRDAVATVAAGGLITAQGQGMATISALHDGMRGTASVEVSALELNPSQVDLRPGQSIQFDIGGVSNEGAVWSSSDESVIIVDQIGNARAVGSGGAMVTVTIGEAAASAAVDVEPMQSLTIMPDRPLITVGQTSPLFAQAMFAGSVMQDVTSVVGWSSSAPSFTVSDVEGSKGHTTRVTAESATITATFEDRIASVRIPATCSEVLVPGLTFESLGANAVGMMLADADTIYWFDFDRFSPALGVLRYVPKRDGLMLALVSGLSGVEQFAIDDTHVYWKESPNGQDQILRRVPKMSVETETIWSSIGLGGGGGGVAVDGTHVYWADGAAARVHRMPKEGGAIEELGDGNFSGPSLQVDDEWVYLATRDQIDSVRRAHKTDGRVQTLATGLADVRLYGVDDGAVYAVERQAVVAIPLDGGPTRILSPLSSGGGVHLGMDARYVYFPDQRYSAISRVPKSGGTPEVVVDNCSAGTDPGQGFSPVSTVIDGDRIYIIDRGGSLEHQARLLAAPKSP